MTIRNRADRRELMNIIYELGAALAIAVLLLVF